MEILALIMAILFITFGVFFMGAGVHYVYEGDSVSVLPILAAIVCLSGGIVILYFLMKI